MRPIIKLASAGALVLVGALGCQKTTTTGPPPATGARPAERTPAQDIGRDARRLTLMAAKDHTVERGETDKMLVTINRDNFNDAVQIRLNDLPQGVDVLEPNAVIAPDDNTVTLTLRANDSAPVGDHLVTLVAEAPGVERNTQTFKLRIKDD
jgi:hypothetical protein